MIFFLNILGIHDCACPEGDAKRIVRALPKKGSEFQIRAPSGTGDYVWGIYARYLVSSIRVFGIHVAILAVTIGLWVWWQIKHPDDLQEAFVPVTVAGICISTFGASTGILKGMR
ncbi:unnamed protein product [Periconia digitata]|uniref:Uncharacterized protein n=1 Tax=Periconia digitata TaxID=1303443 RepID=A0A9W4U8D9_9PLEO|nr:unnamed protein product [Periconia digitata]